MTTSSELSWQQTSDQPESSGQQYIQQTQYIQDTTTQPRHVCFIPPPFQTI